MALGPDLLIAFETTHHDSDLTKRAFRELILPFTDTDQAYSASSLYGYFPITDTKKIKMSTLTNTRYKNSFWRQECALHVDCIGWSQSTFAENLIFIKKIIKEQLQSQTRLDRARYTFNQCIFVILPDDFRKQYETHLKKYLKEFCGQNGLNESQIGIYYLNAPTRENFEEFKLKLKHRLQPILGDLAVENNVAQFPLKPEENSEYIQIARHKFYETLSQILTAYNLSDKLLTILQHEFSIIVKADDVREHFLASDEFFQLTMFFEHHLKSLLEAKKTDTAKYFCINFFKLFAPHPETQEPYAHLLTIAAEIYNSVKETIPGSKCIGHMLLKQAQIISDNPDERRLAYSLTDLVEGKAIVGDPKTHEELQRHPRYIPVIEAIRRARINFFEHSGITTSKTYSGLFLPPPLSDAKASSSAAAHASDELSQRIRAS